VTNAASSPTPSPAERRRGLRLVLVAIGAASYASISGQIVLGWAAFDVSGSELAVGLVFALRMLPQLALGLTAGRLSDRTDRWAIVALLSAAHGVFATVISFGTVYAPPSLVAICGLSAIFGAIDALRMASTQALVYELSGPEHALRALSFANLASHLVGFGAGLAAGALLTWFGFAVAFVSIAMVQVSAAVLMLGRHDVRRRTAAVIRERGRGRQLGGPTIAPERAPDLLASPELRSLAAYAVATEVLAFSAIVLLPAFAERVFAVGADGLGALYSVRALGAMVGLVVLARARSRFAGDGLLVTLGVLFGIALVAFAVSPTIWAASASIALIGAAGGGFDALNQALFADRVSAEQRGAAMGLWVAAIGSAPIGHVEIGALAVIMGPVAAQLVNGVTLLVVTAAFARSRRLGRRARCRAQLPE
jgi:MFS family permease